MSAEKQEVSHDVMYLAFGEILANVGKGVAEAQFAMDRSAILGAEMMGGHWIERDLETGLPKRNEHGQPNIIDSRMAFGYAPELASAELKVDAITDNKIITGNNSIVILDPGKSYSSVPTVQIVSIDGSQGTGATATATIDNGGKVTAIKVTNGGENYEQGKVRILIEGGDPKPEPQLLSMIELGFTPHFYHFVDTVISMKLAIKITRTNEGTKLQTVQVDAQYANTYSFQAEFAATVQTKIVPIPPPAVLEERARRLSEENRDRK